MSDLSDGPRAARSEKIALTNVRVFDGRELRGLTAVVIEGGIVGDNSEGARIIDAGGATLLPGLIDAHVHLLNEGHLQQLADFWGHERAGHGGLAAIHGRLAAQQNRYGGHSQRRHPRDHRR